MAKNDTKADASKDPDKAYQEFAKSDEGKDAAANKLTPETAEIKEQTQEPEKHPLVAAAEAATANVGPGAGVAAAAAPAPYQAPPMTAADGWLPDKHYVLCWVKAEKGKVVEIQAASEYEASHVDTGTGNPHDVMVDKGVEVPVQKK